MSDEALEGEVWQALRGVQFPGMSRDIVSFGFVDRVAIDRGRASIHLVMVTQKADAAETVRQEAEAAVRALSGIDDVDVSLDLRQPRPAGSSGVTRDAGLVPEVESIIAVASGKGGVGKSTVAANLAVALARLGHRVGLLDADIYGPSMPLMFGITERPRVTGNRVIPFDRYGVRVMSLGFVVDPDTPVIWRGPMVMKAIEQLLGDVEWGPLDYLVVDLPPGTGDAQLTITQRVPLSGAVIVTTPQDVALVDARKGLNMFRKVDVPVVGIIENMSGFVCPHCGESTDVFKRGGGERAAEELGTAFLGRVPLDPEIASGGDAGVPIAVAEPDGPHARVFRELAEAVIGAVAAEAASRPSMTIV